MKPNFLFKLKPHVLFRLGSYLHTITAILWTVIIVIPYPPFNYLLPIIEKGGPGVWFLFGYIAYLIAGPLSFGLISVLLKGLEEEKQRLNEAAVELGFYLSYSGVLCSSVLLAVAGSLGGYYMYFADYPPKVVSSFLSAFVLPTTLTVFLAVVGYLLIVFSMILSEHEE